MLVLGFLLLVATSAIDFMFFKQPNWLGELAGMPLALKALFLTPWHAGALFCLLVGAFETSHSGTGGIKVIGRDGEIRASLNPSSAWRSVLTYLIAIPIVALIASVVAWQNYPHFVWLSPAVCLAVLLPCPGIALKATRRERAGVGDLVIRPREGSLDYWPVFASAPKRLDLGLIESVTVRSFIASSNDSARNVAREHVTLLILTEGDPVKLQTWSSKSAALAFARWLSQQLGVPLRG